LHLTQLPSAPLAIWASHLYERKLPNDRRVPLSNYGTAFLSLLVYLLLTPADNYQFISFFFFTVNVFRAWNLHSFSLCLFLLKILKLPLRCKLCLSFCYEPETICSCPITIRTFMLYKELKVVA
jgi:hypothetical protein